MIKKYWNRRELPYIIAAIVLGSLCHFVYGWTSEHALAALFCPVNESVWEHLKLLYFPYLLVITYIYFKKDGQKKLSLFRYYCSRFFAVLLGMLATVTLFYTYTGILGQHFLIADIAIFIASVLLTFLLASFFYYKCSICKDAAAIIFAGWILVTLCFFIWTCYPPDIPLFFAPA